MTALVLKLDCAGRPVAWVTREDGALLYCRDQVLWKAGRDVLTLRGGTSSVTGEQSVLAVPFVPNRAEGLILANRRILVDQMDYLRAQAGRHSRLARA